MRGQARISPIYKHGTSQDPDPLATYARIDRLKRLAWQKQGIVAVTIAELPEDIGALVKAWAEDQYGLR